METGIIREDGKGYMLYRCPECSAIYTFPTPTQMELAVIYSRDYWRSEDIQQSGGLDSLLARFNYWRLKMVIRPLLDRLPLHARILEIGCGAGQLTRILLDQGMEVEVTESSEEMLKLVTEQFGIKGHLGDLTDLSIKGGFDGVIFNHVLEHVTTPAKNILCASELLNPGGLLFVEIPNIGSLQFRIFGSRWYHLDIPVHLTHFSTTTLDSVAEMAGFESIWRSYFSPRTSVAGIVVSIFPGLNPRLLHVKGSMARYSGYLLLQILFLPLALLESLAGLGGIMRTIYKKVDKLR